MIFPVWGCSETCLKFLAVHDSLLWHRSWVLLRLGAETNQAGARPAGGDGRLFIEIDLRTAPTMNPARRFVFPRLAGETRRTG